MKYFLILFISFSKISYSQVAEYNYNSIIERVRDKKDSGQLNVIDNSYKEIKSIVIVNDTKKTITISRKYISKTGESIDEFENYDFVKKEKADGNADQYYCVDLANKKYLEFLIGVERTIIMENCDGFNGCQKFIELAK